MFDDFLQIFKSAFHKFCLVGVKNLGERVSKNNRKYYRFIGKFEFEPPKQIFNSEIEENKPYILNEFRNLDLNTSNCISRKFTKKLLSGKNVVKKVEFQYIFDIVPQNVIDFALDESKGKMYLYVLGYGTF